ncbi:MAG TPA: cytochrome c oxidase subunit 3 [Sphingobacteriaceae bacterium]
MKQPFLIEEEKTNLRAKKFLMWLFLISSFMLFAALTSAFIVYTGGDPNRGIKTYLPNAFIFSTAAIFLSSITMHLAFLSGKKMQLDRQKLYLVITILLGIVFFVLQVMSWQALIKQGIYFVNFNASQSFIYVFTGAHLVHILGGLIMLAGALLGGIRQIPQVRNVFRLEITSIFWHFVDILWIYLYVFLLLNQ